MSPIKTSGREIAQWFIRYLGVDLIRSSRSPVLASLTSLRNIINGRQPVSHSVIERLGSTVLGIQLEWLLGRLEIDGVIDVGANIGQFATELREMSFQGHIVSFEPHHLCFQQLERHSRNDARWHVHPVALGAEEEKSELHHFSDSTLSSMHRISKPETLGDPRTADVTESRCVEVRKLDKLWPDLVTSLGMKRVMLKTDTQGHDLEVLKGARHALKECVLLMCEIAFRPIYTDAPDYLELLQFIRQQGYECVAISPLWYDKKKPVLNEANGLFVNTTAFL
jgi:FkbM family methyltransferase